MINGSVVVPIESEEVACDLCGSTEALPLYTLTDVVHQLPGEFTLRRCTNCGLIYLSPRPTPNSIGLYYPPDYAPYRPPIEDERLALMRYMRRRKLIKRRALIEKYSAVPQGRVLDVGCATGLFLHEMQLAGWEAVGVEPVLSAAELARQRFGLQVYHGMLAEAPFEPHSFDVITFWDVLEHTFSPRAELAQVAHLLKPGGLIAINVPNWDSFDRKPFGAHWQGFDPPRHLYVFTRQTLTQLLAQAGFHVLDWVCFMPGFFTWVVSVQRWLLVKHPRWAKLVLRLLMFPGVRLLFEPWFALMNARRTAPVISIFAQRLDDQRAL
jgi:2-polyprenyl-3-methyl-5-hydroxy-6-metoxy-1,4-benzoquinol methylase